MSGFWRAHRDCAKDHFGEIIVHRYSIAILLQAVCPILGIDPKKLLESTDWTSAERPGADQTVSGADFVAMSKAIFALARDPSPVFLGTNMANGPLHPIFLAFAIAPNAREGLRRMARYKTLFGPTVLNLAPKNGGLRLEIISDDPTLTLPDCLTVPMGVFVVEKCRNHSARRIVPDALVLPPDSIETAGIQEFFGIEPVDGKNVVIEFSAHDMDAPFMSENHELWLDIKNDLDGQLERRAGTGKFSNALEAAIRRALTTGLVRVDALCADLGLSRSTMQRKLQHEGVSYQQILDMVRQDLAIRYLAKSRLTPGEIAQLVGFSDPKSFYRAFKSWTNKSPAVFREEAQA